ncbi:MAG: Fe(3+) ABC transporter substrate-binding protein [Cyanobacteria bacterium]|nr:Fe(3+) ABC transporter substrate-binding protein [Cyanobacteria bacterium CG_2015-16_32_12]NCO77194.1 Fe(3+) ABC transporter substrate-binding protein [Cyanobacteria bacterium CG_2015-22_32_23]NCQ05629.1 Fe(3+) ABC transporter substrate-binding protein [Cyanobacteria bacterium CG_2015-09_32_10]NCQ42139.1 Fe(3+) ABC transporter substrate-binding protein [Cyanobacteria bacterium CG_2015-04_32_10]NCS84793.1 Fe(3+) ABC transporter substrate-binding protein [Cyanobacteria bacterium CG_2015-02_32_
MNKVTRRVFLGTSATIAAITLAELTGVKDTSAQSKQINLYSGRHYNTDKKLYTDFEKQTGIKVNLVEGDGKQLLERLKNEGRNSKADVFLTADAGNLWQAQQTGIFTPVNSSILKQKIPAYFRDPQNNWFGFSKRVRVIMYNKSKVNPSQLSTYEDLANPKWKGKIVIRSSGNIYNQSMVAWLIAINGQQKTEQWCRGIVANMARPPQGGDRDQIEAVAAGIADLALANTYYLAGYGSSKDPAKKAIFDKIGVFFPNQKGKGSHVNISGGGVIKTAPNKDGAIKFLEYLVSPGAQRFFAQGNNEYPVVSGVELDPILKGFGSFKSDVTNVANFGPNLANALKMMDRAGWK